MTRDDGILCEDELKIGNWVVFDEMSFNNILADADTADEVRSWMMSRKTNPLQITNRRIEQDKNGLLVVENTVVSEGGSRPPGNFPFYSDELVLCEWDK